MFGNLSAADSSGEGRLRSAGLPEQLTPTRSHLQQIFVARNAVLLVGSVGVAGMAAAGSALRSPGIAAILAVLALLNLLTWHRLRRSFPVSYNEFLLHILADVALLSAALCLSGGGASPFHELYFVPLTIAAATLPWKHTLIAALAIVGSRELACLYYVPLPAILTLDHETVELLAGGLIAYFVFRMAKTSRRHEQILARAKEDYLKERHSAELGTLAAAAADQLSSPLSTMAVVVGELRDDDPGRPAERKQALEVMAKQIETCKQVSSRLLATAGNRRAEGGGKVPADGFCAAIVDKCQLMQPWMTLRCRYEGEKPAPEILADSSLEQAILVLLKSACGTAPRVEISVRWDEKRLQIDLRAPRSRAAADAHPGAPLFARTALAPADRLELLMAKATIGRFGGAVGDPTHTEGQVCVRLSLALFGVLTGST